MSRCFEGHHLWKQEFINIDQKFIVVYFYEFWKGDFMGNHLPGGIDNKYL